MVGALIFSAWAMAQDCHYQTWSWGTRERRPMDVRQVATFKNKLTAEERGPHAGCTICEEDQRSVTVAGLTFKMCQRYAGQIAKTLQQLQAQGFSLRELEGYRVGKSKGEVDARGWRTQYSHHSYGVALDINANLNGLYDNCVSFSSSCRLLRGGHYDPNINGAITLEVAQLFKSIGMKWGGEIQGQQKDFMHFSPTGD